MTSAYLYLNAAIYLLLAVWCTLAPARTAAAVGYASLTRSGQTDDLTIYGGLQLGLAFLFAWVAWTQQMRTGLVLAMALYPSCCSAASPCCAGGRWKPLRSRSR